MYYPTVAERQQKCFEKLASISKENDETLTNYYSTVGATLITRKKREITDDLWKMHEKLKEEYAKTYIKCIDDIRPSK